jgi:hypothetical protein
VKKTKEENKVVWHVDEKSMRGLLSKLEISNFWVDEFCYQGNKITSNVQRKIDVVIRIA